MTAANITPEQRALAAGIAGAVPLEAPVVAGYTPGPWEIRRGYRDGVFYVCRSVAPNFVQYLGANGKAKSIPSFFRSEEAARAAITRATGGGV